jgi:hypothetical protein
MSEKLGVRTGARGCLFSSSRSRERRKAAPIRRFAREVSGVRLDDWLVPVEGWKDDASVSTFMRGLSP